MGLYFPLHANLSGAGSLAQNTVIAFHTLHEITLLGLQIIAENVVLHTISMGKKIFFKTLAASVTERHILFHGMKSVFLDDIHVFLRF